MKACQRGSIGRIYLKELIAAVAIASFVFGTISCSVVATTGDFYGNTTPPKRNILRYVNGDEPGSLDPPVSNLHGAISGID